MKLINKEIYTYHCSSDNQSWIASIEILYRKKDYITFVCEGVGSRIVGILGNNTMYRWVCFPDFELATSLSYLSDIFWNCEKLIMLFSSSIDGITIATGLKTLNEIYEGCLF